MTHRLTRRGVIGRLALTLSLGNLPITGRTATEPVVETRYGKVRGALNDGVYSFKGLRYGESTAGEGRFMPPKPPKPWSGVADATAFGNSAPQSNPTPPPPGALSPIILSQIPPPAGASSAPRPRLPESEDCLFLNVWTSGVADGRKRPVMFWLHPGFFASGSGSAVDGAALARSGDVVVVSINHRLNVFGYTDLSEQGGKDFATSANAGMLDVILALEWVHDNIERFGGDPKRVMVFGESGGGMKTSFLLASPRAKGLLHRAGVQSGPGLKMIERERSVRVTHALMKTLRLDAAKPRDLQQVPMEKLLGAYFSVRQKDFPDKYFTDLECFAPVVDGVILPRHPFSPDATALSAGIPLLIGWNQTEMTFFMGADAQGFALDDAALKRRAEGFLGDRAARAIDLYRRRYPGSSASELYIQMWSDFSIADATLKQADRKAALEASRAPAADRAGVYVYRFDWRSPALGGKLKSPHSIENAFVWNDLRSSPLTASAAPSAARLAQQVSQAWRSFAATGAPSPPAGGLPAWPAYDPGRRAVMLLDEGSRMVDDPFREERQLFA